MPSPARISRSASSARARAASAWNIPVTSLSVISALDGASHLDQESAGGQLLALRDCSLGVDGGQRRVLGTVLRAREGAHPADLGLSVHDCVGRGDAEHVEHAASRHQAVHRAGAHRLDHARHAGGYVGALGVEQRRQLVPRHSHGSGALVDGEAVGAGGVVQRVHHARAQRGELAASPRAAGGAAVHRSALEVADCADHVAAAVGRVGLHCDAGGLQLCQDQGVVGPFRGGHRSGLVVGGSVLEVVEPALVLRGVGGECLGGVQLVGLGQFGRVGVGHEEGCLPVARGGRAGWAPRGRSSLACGCDIAVMPAQLAA